MKFYAGIDMSLAKAGFSVVDEKGVVVEIRTFHAEDTAIPKVDRVIQNVDGIMDRLLCFGNEEIRFVAIEEPAWGAFKFVSYDIGMAYGIMMEHLVRNEINYITVNPSKLKTYVSGKRFKGKKPVRAWCEDRGVVFPKKVRQEWIFDMADAYVLSEIARVFDILSEDANVTVPMLQHQVKVFRGKDSKGKDSGLLDRPDLYRRFN